MAGPPLGRVDPGAFVPPHGACSSPSFVWGVEDAEGGVTGIVGIRGPFLGDKRLRLWVSSLHRALGGAGSGSSRRGHLSQWQPLKGVPASLPSPPLRL